MTLFTNCIHVLVDFWPYFTGYISHICREAPEHGFAKNRHLGSSDVPYFSRLRGNDSMGRVKFCPYIDSGCQRCCAAALPRTCHCLLVTDSRLVVGHLKIKISPVWDWRSTHPASQTEFGRIFFKGHISIFFQVQSHVTQKSRTYIKKSGPNKVRYCPLV